MRQKTVERLRLQVEAAREEVRQFRAPVAAYTLKGVQSAVGVGHWSTLARWRTLGFPVRRGPDRKVFVLLVEVRAWLLAFHSLQQVRTKARLEAYTSAFHPSASSLSASADTKRPSTVKLQPACQPSPPQGR